MSKFLSIEYYLSLIKGDLVKKSSLLAISTGFGALSRFLLVTILARYLSPESYGVWVLITSIAAIMMFGDFGITNALRNKLSVLAAEGENTSDLQREYFYVAFYFFFFLSTAISIIFLCLVNYIPLDKLYNTANVLLKNQGVELFIFIQLTFIMGIPFGMANGLFFSYDESRFVAIFGVLNSILTLGSVIVLSFILSANIVTIGKTYFLLNFLVYVTSFTYFVYRRKWYKSFSTSPMLAPRRIWELLKTGVLFLSVQLSTSFINNVPTIFIGAVGDLKMAASFNIAQKLYTMVISIYQSIFNPIWSKMSLYANQKNWKDFRKLHKRIVLLSFLAFFVFTILFTIFSKTIFQIVVGSQYESSYTIVFLLGISTMFYVMFEASSLLQNSLGKLKLRTVIQLIVVCFINSLFHFTFSLFGINSIPVSLSLIWLTLFVILTFQGHRLINRIERL